MTDRIRLTEAQVAKAHRKGTVNGKPVSYTFDGHPGLSLNIGKAKSSWQLRKREPDTGRLVAITLGSFPQMDHNAVRIAATEATAQIERMGRHIAANKRDTMPTFGEAFARYCDGQRSVGRINDKTLAGYQRQVRNNLAKLVDRPMDTITRDDLQRQFDGGAPFCDCIGHTATAWACRRIIAAVFDDCDAVETLPTRKLKMTPPRKKKAGDLVELWSDIESLIDNERVNPSIPSIWFFGLFTGIRMEALLSLTWDQIDFKARTVRLDKMKNGLARKLPLADAAVDVLMTQREIAPKIAPCTDLVFPSNRKGKNGWRMYQVRRLKSGSFHETRHHFSTCAAASGMADYAWAFLRGDVLHGGNSGNARMAGTYMHDDGVTRDMANLVAEVILQRVGHDEHRHALVPARGQVWAES